MDYEKKYKEALGRAKKELQICGSSDCDASKQIFRLFPELKESEDERIREVLVDYFKRYKEQEGCGIKTFFGIPTDNIITWLEKQGEQKPQGKTALEAINEEKVDNQFCVKSTNKVEPKFKVKYAGNEYNVLEVKDVSGVTFYGIEDEPNHIDYVKAENCERVDGYNIKENGSLYPTKPAVFSEQKPAWSEEYIADVFEKVGLAKIVREQSNDALTIALQDAMIELSKVTLQPKPTEWSEEDEGILDEIIDFLENGTVKLQHDLSLYASWLKSLKDRYAWKPNDEQMEEEKPRYNIGDIICDKSCTTLNKEAQPNMEIVDIKNGMYICDKGSFPVSQQDEYELVSKKIDTKLNDHSVSNELREASFAHARKEIKNPTCPDNEEFELAYTFEEGAKWEAAQKSIRSKEDKILFDEVNSFLEDLKKN